MKKIGTLSLAIALVMALAIPTGAFAAASSETETLPDPGVTPDSPFYFMDQWGQQISLVFTFNAGNKVQKALNYAEERLAEAHIMAKQNKVQAMERAANEYQNCLEIAIQNMQKAQTEGIDTSEQVVAMTSKHLSYIYQHQYTGMSEDCQDIEQQIGERAQICQENTVIALAAQNPEGALQLGVRLMEQACNRIQNMVCQGDDTQIEEAFQQCERFAALNQEMIASSEQLGLRSEAQQMLQEAKAAQEGVLNQIRSQIQTCTGDSEAAPVQNQTREQRGETTVNSYIKSPQIGSGPMGPAPNSGDGIPDGSGFEDPNGANANSFGKK
jgi:hypothetical protein